MAGKMAATDGAKKRLYEMRNIEKVSLKEESCSDLGESSQGC
jgi:hypothetical protein